MFGFRLNVKCVSGVLLAILVASGASAVEAQSTRRTRRESNANRKARIARTIEATYSHRYEVAGGGGYLRFRSGEYLQKNNEVTFFMTGTYFLNPKLGIIADVRGMYGNAKIGNSTPNFLPFKPQISEYPFMGGVAYRLYAKEKVAVPAALDAVATKLVLGPAAVGVPLIAPVAALRARPAGRLPTVMANVGAGNAPGAEKENGPYEVPTLPTGGVPVTTVGAASTTIENGAETGPRPLSAVMLPA